MIYISNVFKNILKGIFMLKKILLAVSLLLLASTVSAYPKYGLKYVWKVVEFQTPIGQNHINPKTYCSWDGFILLQTPSPGGNPAASIYEIRHEQWEGARSCSNLYIGHPVEYTWYTTNGNTLYTHKTNLWYAGQLYRKSERVVSRELRWVQVPCATRDCGGGPPY